MTSNAGMQNRPTPSKRPSALRYSRNKADSNLSSIHSRPASNLSFKQMKELSAANSSTEGLSQEENCPLAEDGEKIACLEELLFITAQPSSDDLNRWVFPKYFIVSKSYHDFSNFCQKIVPAEGASSFRYVFLKTIYDDRVLKRTCGTQGCPPLYLLLGTLEMLIVVAYPLVHGSMLKSFNKILKQAGLLKFLWNQNETRGLTATVLDTEVKNCLDVNMMCEMLNFKPNLPENCLELIPPEIANSKLWKEYPNQIMSRKNDILKEVAIFVAQISSFRSLFRDSQSGLFNFTPGQSSTYNNYFKNS